MTKIQTMMTARRGFLAGLGVLALGGAGAWALWGRERAMVEQILRRSIPDTPIPAEAVDGFFADFWPDLETRSGLRGEAAMSIREISRAFGLAEDASAAPEREIVTAFLLGSNYFQRNGGNEPVIWLGMSQACNPFAKI